jgi:hypothetical protein
MSEQGPRVCPTCGQPEVGAVLDAVEESVDALFDDLSAFPVRIDLDRELDPGPTSIAVPRATLDGLEELLLGVTQVLSVLRGTVEPGAEDLHRLLDRLSRETASWAQRLSDLTHPAE